MIKYNQNFCHQYLYKPILILIEKLFIHTHAVTLTSKKKTFASGYKGYSVIKLIKRTAILQSLYLYNSIAYKYRNTTKQNQVTNYTIFLPSS
jgi:hypothetical protein